MIGNVAVHGHAIVSADDRIADAAGDIPPALHNAADWRRFQAALDAAAVTVLGRIGHAAYPSRRNRLVLSSQAEGIERRDGAWWWNPARAPAEDAFARAAPGGGIAAVTGGRHVFDFFLHLGFDAFYLSRSAHFRLPDGVPIFSAVGEGLAADVVLTGSGLQPGASILLDPVAAVTLTVWRTDAYSNPSKSAVER